MNKHKVNITISNNKENRDVFFKTRDKIKFTIKQNNEVIVNEIPISRKFAEEIKIAAKIKKVDISIDENIYENAQIIPYTKIFGIPLHSIITQTEDGTKVIRIEIEDDSTQLVNDKKMKLLEELKLKGINYLACNWEETKHITKQ